MNEHPQRVISAIVHAARYNFIAKAITRPTLGNITAKGDMRNLFGSD
ncbi:hypothetical protein [Methylotenera sp. G11]|nr:hypothetical protein [Methylotenera sp. G11]